MYIQLLILFVGLVKMNVDGRYCGHVCATLVRTGNRTDLLLEFIPSQEMETYIKVVLRHYMTKLAGEFNSPLSITINPNTTTLKYVAQNNRLVIINITNEDFGRCIVSCATPQPNSYLQIGYSNAVIFNFIPCLHSYSEYSAKLDYQWLLRTDLYECAPKPCRNGGTCTNLLRGYTCTCTEGYSSIYCKTDKTYCDTRPCRTGGTCLDSVYGHTCVCLENYDRYTCINSTTDDIDECASTPCQNSGTCIDLLNGYACYCLAGYTGTLCENDIDECASTPCQNGGTCTGGLNRYECSCLTGYNGNTCEIDIDECASAPCHNGGICTDVVNGYTCACIIGYNSTDCKTETVVGSLLPKYCAGEEDEKGTSWEQTNAGEILTKPCLVGYQGEITRKCSIQGFWSPPYYNCVRSTLQELYNWVFAASKIPTASLVSSILANFSRETSTDNLDTESLLPGELKAVTASLYEIAKMSNNVTVDTNQVKNFLRTASNLVDDENTESWISVLRSEEQTSPYRGASGLMKAVEKYSEAFKDTSQNGTEVKEANIVFKIQNIKVTDNVPEDIRFPERELMEEQNIISYYFLSTQSLKGVERYSSVYFKNLSAILPTDSTDNLTTLKKHTIINGPVLSLKLLPNVGVLERPLDLYFYHFEDFYTDPICSFWNFTSNGWSNEGCSMVSTNSTTTHCRCQHLTNFAILMSPYKQDVSKALSIITQVGCSVSVAGLVVTILLHLALWSYVKSKKSALLISLSTVLLTVYILFMAGVDSTENERLCKAVAMMLHYFLLAAFFLMLSSTMEIAICVSFVFAAKSNTLKVLLPCSFGIPALIVTVTASTRSLKGYGTDTYCWLSTEDSFIWAFIGPAALVIAINIVLLVLILRAAFSVKCMTKKTQLQKFKNTIKCLCVLVPLMGVSWLFGMFYINDDTQRMQYVFAVCNSLQGLFIFIFQCVFNEKIRKGILHQKRKYSSSLTAESTLAKTSQRDKGETLSLASR